MRQELLNITGQRLFSLSNIYVGIWPTLDQLSFLAASPSLHHFLGTHGGGDEERRASRTGGPVGGWNQELFLHLHLWAWRSTQMCQYEGWLDRSKADQWACFTGILFNRNKSILPWHFMIQEYNISKCSQTYGFLIDRLCGEEGKRSPPKRLLVSTK